MTWDKRYRPLEKGEVILPTDEILHDDRKWRTPTFSGGLAPDPNYTSHRQYRRLKAPHP